MKTVCSTLLALLGDMLGSRRTNGSETVRRGAICAAVAGVLMAGGGCSTAPKHEDRQVFTAESRAATQWFQSRVKGLDAQVQNSAGYIIYPSVGQWGIIIGGGKFGRGMVNRPDGQQIGWAAVNTTSLGLQAGVQDFKMLVVFQDEHTLESFMANRLAGSVGAVAVLAEGGGSAAAQFENGVAIYQGANQGLMAGVNIGLDYMRYVPLE